MRINLVYHIWLHFLFFYMLNLRQVRSDGYSDDVIFFNCPRNALVITAMIIWQESTLNMSSNKADHEAISFKIDRKSIYGFKYHLLL